MPREFDRARAIRQLKLPDDADDARIMQAIRGLTSSFRKMKRPLVLPRHLDLAGCVAAIDQRVEDEVALGLKIYAEIRERQDRVNEIDRRLLCLEIIRRAWYAPPDPPPKK